MQVCTSLQTDNHASTPPLSFLQAGCPSCRPTNSVKALKAPAHSNKETWETETSLRRLSDHRITPPALRSAPAADGGEHREAEKKEPIFSSVHLFCRPTCQKLVNFVYVY